MLYHREAQVIKTWSRQPGLSVIHALCLSVQFKGRHASHCKVMCNNLGMFVCLEKSRAVTPVTIETGVFSLCAIFDILLLQERSQA